MSIKIRISEVFDSIQGEGFWTGLPATFVRLQGCNLRCSWCDTPQAQSSARDNLLRSVKGISEDILVCAPKHVVITGGEPLLQPRALVALCELLEDDRRIHIETNGTLPLPPELRHCWVTVSPKPPGYTIHSTISPSEIKVVITGSEDLQNIHKMADQPAFAYLCLQPVNNDPDIIQMCVDYLTRQRSRYTWGLSVQVHKLINIK